MLLSSWNTLLQDRKIWKMTKCWIFDAKTLTYQDRIFLKFCSWPAFFSFKFVLQTPLSLSEIEYHKELNFLSVLFFRKYFQNIDILRENKLVKFWPPNETSESDKKFCKNLGKFEYSRRERRLCKEQW